MLVDEAVRDKDTVPRGDGPVCDRAGVPPLAPGYAPGVKLSDDRPASINVVGNWLYYANHADGLSLYRIRTDGSERQRLYEGWVDCINVVGGIGSTTSTRPMT